MTNKEKRAAVVKRGRSRKGKNSYTQGSKRVYVGGYPVPGENVKGFSDCSSYVRWCYLKECGVDIGYNTAAQIVSKKLVTVCGAKGGQPADKAAMLPGDLLYFKGTNKSRPFGVGHVEMYIGGGKLSGHGSGTGPKEKDMADYCRYRQSGGHGLIRVMRFIPADASDGTPSTPATPSTPDSYLGFGKRVLTNGDDGPDVAAMQRALISLGYSCGRYGADSEYGPGTESAVKAFQTDNGLDDDGEVGPETVAAFERLIPEDGDPEPDTDPVAPPPPTIPAQVVKVTGGTVYIRTQPGTKGKIMGVVKKGDTLTANGETADGWRGVEYNGEDAWISTKYTEVA